MFGHHKIPPAQHWIAAAPALEQLGLHRIDAELYVTDRLYVRFDLSDGGVRAWIKSHTGGTGMLDGSPRQAFELKPGGSAHGELAAWIAAQAGELAALPKHARLQITTPDIPGSDYELTITCPLEAPEHAVITARVLLALDDAVRRPAGPAGIVAAGRQPPAAAAWIAAAPALEALGLSRVDAELFTGDSLYVTFDVASGGVHAWFERAAPGGLLDGAPNQSFELRAGHAGHSEIAQRVLAIVQAELAALPKQARLQVTTPEIPGAMYKLRLTTPLASADQAVVAARAMLALDSALRRP
jgi:hypothetical protein|nr:hypothetical protein [Kofleriaceae bacterium]